MSKSFRVVPQIYQYETCKEFVEEFKIGTGDLIFTNSSYYDKCFKDIVTGAYVVYAKKYGTGEPTDTMVDQIAKDISEIPFERVIGIGGGSIIDVSKLLVQEHIFPVKDLYDKKMPAKKVKELIIVPTTCGTGSEVTSVAVIELTERNTKLGLQTDEEFADKAVLIPELLHGLPHTVFATSSIDALVHAVESYLSPKATVFSELFSIEAMKLILNGYMKLIEEGMQTKDRYISDFLLASNYAGIAFGNAGCAAVHAMSMSFSGKHHVPHGEANYALFIEVLRRYKKIKPEGKIERLNEVIAECIGCKMEEVYENLEEILNQILYRKGLSEYGVKEDEIPIFVHTVETKQGRLTANNYVELSKEEMTDIYHSLL